MLLPLFAGTVLSGAPTGMAQLCPGWPCGGFNGPVDAVVGVEDPAGVADGVTAPADDVSVRVAVPPVVSCCAAGVVTVSTAAAAGIGLSAAGRPSSVHAERAVSATTSAPRKMLFMVRIGSMRGYWVGKIRYVLDRFIDDEIGPWRWVGHGVRDTHAPMRRGAIAASRRELRQVWVRREPGVSEPSFATTNL